MPKSWQPGKRGARDLERWIRKGATVYTVSKQALNAAPWEDAKMYRAHTFDGRSPITGHWMTDHMSAEGLLNTHGTVYEQPPRGMRELGSPGRQVAGPLGHNDYRGYLDDSELRGLEKRVQNGSDPYTRPSRGERGRRR